MRTISCQKQPHWLDAKYNYTVGDMLVIAICQY